MTEMSGEQPLLWWHTQNEEQLDAHYPTREECILAGALYYCGDPFLICEGRRFRNQVPAFDSWFAEAFDDLNADYATDDHYPSEGWADEPYKALIAKLTAVADEWLDENGYRGAHAIDTAPYERIVPDALLLERARKDGDHE